MQEVSEESDTEDRLDQRPIEQRMLDAELAIMGAWDAEQRLAQRVRALEATISRLRLLAQA